MESPFKMKNQSIPFWEHQNRMHQHFQMLWFGKQNVIKMNFVPTESSDANEIASSTGKCFLGKNWTSCSCNP